jgi:hypothetical protein
MDHPSTTISQDDLVTLAHVALLRLPLRGPESERAARFRTLIAAASELSRTVASHTHCMLVNCQGSHGVGDLAAESRELFHALARYAELVREIAREYRRFTVDGAPLELVGVTDGTVGMLRAG